MSIQNLEKSRRELILDYIRNNQGCSKVDVEGAMDGVASKVTVRNIIHDLETDNLIIAKKDKPNSQKYHLYINPEDEFNRINDSISRVEEMAKFIEERGGPLFEHSIRNKMKNLKKAEIDKIFSRHYEIRRSCYEDMTSLSHLLVYEIGSKIKTKEKSQILYSRIIELMQQLHIEEGSEDFDQIMNQLQIKIDKVSALMK